MDEVEELANLISLETDGCSIDGKGHCVESSFYRQMATNLIKAGYRKAPALKVLNKENVKTVIAYNFVGRYPFLTEAQIDEFAEELCDQLSSPQCKHVELYEGKICPCKIVMSKWGEIITEQHWNIIAESDLPNSIKQWLYESLKAIKECSTFHAHPSTFDILIEKAKTLVEEDKKALQEALFPEQPSPLRLPEPSGIHKIIMDFGGMNTSNPNGDGMQCAQTILDSIKSLNKETL